MVDGESLSFQQKGLSRTPICSVDGIDLDGAEAEGIFIDSRLDDDLEVVEFISTHPEVIEQLLDGTEFEDVPVVSVDHSGP